MEMRGVKGMVKMAKQTTKKAMKGVDSFLKPPKQMPLNVVGFVSIYIFKITTT